MMVLTRRGILGMAAGGVAATLSLGGPARADRVLIVGGGAAGMTAVRVLRRNAPESKLVLVDRYPGRDAAALPAKGVAVFRDEIGDVDWASGTAFGRNGARYGFDRLVLAPGIGFETAGIAGYDLLALDSLAPYWSGAEDEAKLMRRVDALETGSTVVITVPPRPYRFAAGPYLRAARITDRLGVRGKVLLVDANPTLPDEASFDCRVERIVEPVIAVDSRAPSVSTPSGRLTGDLINVIPPQSAGPLARRAGLAAADGWCPVDPASGRSLLRSRAFVIGDAADHPDKTAAAAAAQARRLAEAVV